MRNLTFGALIVLVGFIAALPFRKTPPPGLTDADASLATGPSTGLVVTDESVSFNPLARSGSMMTGAPSSQPWDEPRAHVTAASDSLVSQRHPQMAARIPSDAQPSPRRDLRLPLTYEDLAVPLVTPGYVDARFDAVAKNARPAIPSGAPSATPSAKPNAAAIDPPSTRFEPFAMINASQSPEPAAAPFQRFDTRPPSILASADEPADEPVATSDAKSNGQAEIDPVAVAKLPIEGRLASDSRPSLKEEKPDDRPRHWIRQPGE